MECGIQRSDGHTGFNHQVSQIYLEKKEKIMPGADFIGNTHNCYQDISQNHKNVNLMVVLGEKTGITKVSKIDPHECL